MNELNNTMDNVMENVAEAMPKTGGSGNLVAFVAGVGTTLLIEGGIKLAKRAWNKRKAKAEAPAAESNEKKDENNEQPKEENGENK